MAVCQAVCQAASVKTRRALPRNCISSGVLRLATMKATPEIQFLLYPARELFPANSTTDDSTSDPRAVSGSTAVDLELVLGPRQQDISTAVPVTVIYALIFVTGLVGNVSTCVVIARNHYMHTTTNYCLFNLAVSDLLMLLLGLPQETYTIWSAYPWIFGETFCVLR